LVAVQAEVDLTTLAANLRRQGQLVAHTVYECGECGERYLGERRCPDCGCFCRLVGLGGNCPECDQAVAVIDLVGGVER
jgi:hypothetical protein